MTEDQDITHVRGDDLQIPVTVTLDASRTLDDSETWSWYLRRDATSPRLIFKTDAGGTITTDGSTFQPTVVIADTDFPVTTFPPSTTDQKFVHELQMTKDGLKETVMRGTFTLRADVVR